MVNLKESSTHEKKVIQNLLKSAVVTGIVYMNPNGIDVNTPPVNIDGGSFVNHKKACN